MRIAYICADAGVPVFGRKGCSVHVQAVLQSMVRAGHDVTLFAARFGGQPSAELESVRVLDLSGGEFGASLEAEAREQGLVAMNHSLHQALQAVGPFDLVYERYSLWSMAGMTWAASTGTKAILEVNAPLVEEQGRHRALVNKALAQTIARTVFRSATAVVAVSDEVGAYVRSAGGYELPVCIIPNGFDPDRFKVPHGDRRFHEDSPFTIGFVGSLKPWHGVTLLVDAVAEVSTACHHVRLLIVGDGPQRDSVVERVRAHSMEKLTTFAGAVAHDAIPGYLQQMDVGAAPYASAEDFYFSPMKVVEYMAAGVCPVVSAAGQLRTLVVDGRNGFLCAPGDVADLARQLRRRIADREATRRIGIQAREDIASQTWDAVVSRSIAFVESIALRHAGHVQVA